jgi:hypothetical protein
MTNNSINFKREREFGDLFNATFNFLGLEYKKLGKALLYYVVPLLILSAIASTIYSIKSQEAMQLMREAGNNDPFASFKVLGSIFGYVFISSALSIVATTLLMCTVYCYIKVYIENGANQFTLNDVWREVMKHFLKFLIASIIVCILMGIGFVFCILPGVYLAVALTPLFCIMIFEEKSFADSFSRSFKLINNNWWFVFGLLIVATIIVYILSMLVSIPNVLMGFKSLFVNLKTGNVTDFKFSTSFYIVNSITQLITNLFWVIPTVTTAFLYFSLVEKVERPSLIEKINQINDNE